MQAASAIAAKGVCMVAVLVPAVLLQAFGIGAARADDPDPYAGQRRALVAELRMQAGRGPGTRIDADALALIGRVPRHAFVPEQQRRDAYRNRPLGIGYGQTISQPYIVALMTTLAKPAAGKDILEVGTGSGYQAAVLAESGARVYSVEIIEPLAKRAAQALREQGYDNVTTRIADGYYGWEEHAPFDAIVVTAAASSIPPPLVEQLKPGGRMVIPVGAAFMTQTLMLVEKADDGSVRTRQILPVRFVPLTRGNDGHGRK